MEAAIIGAPLDLGAGRRGVDMGPSAIRYAGLEERLTALGVDCVDRGNVATAVAEATAEHDPRARFLPAIKATCGVLRALVTDSHNPYHRVWELLREPERSRSKVKVTSS